MTENSTQSKEEQQDIIFVSLSEDLSLDVHVAPMPLLGMAVVVLVVLLASRLWFGRSFREFQIDGAEIGIGNQKISLKPNDTDRQIAYSIWVELSTRKIGLPIDVENDVIYQIYDSWYAFFGVTRELVKSIPVSKVRENSTSQIVDLSVEVLNEGLRPHLTKWQSRFRFWNDRLVDDKSGTDPQEIQQNFPDYDELIEDLLLVNKKLIAYRSMMYKLARM